jgi:hypothetical protein
MELIDETPDALVYQGPNGPIQVLKSLLPPGAYSPGQQNKTALEVPFTGTHSFNDDGTVTRYDAKGKQIDRIPLGDAIKAGQVGLNEPPRAMAVSAVEQPRQVGVVPQMMGASQFGRAPAPLPAPIRTGDDVHATPPGYDASIYTDDTTSTPDTGKDVVKAWQLSPDGKFLVGKTANGETVTTSIAQGQSDAAAGRSTIPPELMPKPPGGDSAGPAGIALQTAMGAALPGAGNPAPAGGDYMRSVKAELGAIAEGAKSGAARAAEVAAYQAKLADQMDQQQAQQAQKQGDRQRSFDDQVRQLQQSMATFNSEKIDPSHFWASRSTGQKMLAGIGLALGAMGSAFTGGPNQALGIIQSAIDRDIEAQKANLSKAQQGVQNQASLLGIYRQKFQDDAQAEAATRATMLQNAALRTQAMAAKYDAPELKAKAQQAAAQLGAEAAKAMDDFKQRAFERSLQTAQLGVEQEKLGLAGVQRQQQLNSRFVPGLGYALDEKSADELRKRYPAYQNASSLVDELAKLRGSDDSAAWSPTKINQMRGIAAKLKFALQQNEGLSRLSDEDVKQLDQVAGGDPARIGYVLPVLQQLSTQLDDEFRRTASSYLDPNLPNALQRRPAAAPAR